MRGRVTDDLGAPLGESKIMFAPSSETGHYNEITTRSDGSFELPFARGSYRIGVQAADHTTEWWSEAASFADATDIVLGPGETRTINVSLTKSGFIRGRIVNQYGLPALTGVYAYRRAGTAWVLEQLTVPLASDGGNYSLVDLPPGTYRLRFGFLPTEPNGNNEY
ncbi:carboxypeptidase-like regulatory domain-containing protein [Nocardioides sp. C4-1]|uniref:carboxypeptidase-like regulatory domain-containing protein n=1 Tax=Nocardioides sp. C4-1 TaxID=3151851 RepID=UPI003263DA56